MIKVRFLILIFILSLFNCTVNENTGRIRVINRTQIALENVKIGDRRIVYKVKPGNYYDYWYFNEITGKLISDNIKTRETLKNATFTLRTGYWVWITAALNDEDEEEISLEAESHIHNDLSSSDYIDFD